MKGGPWLSPLREDQQSDKKHNEGEWLLVKVGGPKGYDQKDLVFAELD